MVCCKEPKLTSERGKEEKRKEGMRKTKLGVIEYLNCWCSKPRHNKANFGLAKGHMEHSRNTVPAICGALGFH